MYLLWWGNDVVVRFLAYTDTSHTTRGMLELTWGFILLPLMRTEVSRFLRSFAQWLNGPITNICNSRLLDRVYTYSILYIYISMYFML
jgi:hypothetical protein